MEEDIAGYLQDNGCCSRCILIFLGKFCENIEIENCSNESGDQISPTDHSQSDVKRLKNFVCSSCIGFLQSCNDSDVIDTISAAIIKENYDTTEFGLTITLPPSINLRIHRCWANIIQKFNCPKLIDARFKSLAAFKEVWRNAIGSDVATKIGKTYCDLQSSILKVNALCHYDHDEDECRLLEKLNKEKFELRRKQCRKFNSGVFTKQAISDVLKEFTDDKFLSIIPGWPSVPSHHGTISDVQCDQSSLYIAGRYNKFSRELPQTPWLIQQDKRLHFDTSVQELISKPINKLVKADGVKFSSSGREDVDVRCLGNGRPFIIEFQNPRRTLLNPCDFIELQKQVNEFTKNLVAVKDLQLISKQDTVHLKNGEEEKTKSYCALCISSKPLSEDVLLSRLKNLSPLTLAQTTPLRVLHRRPLCVRERVIYELSCQAVNERFFKVYMRTQAGTYIKEFVHGDFGRTTPNLKTILGAECDIVALDVESVDLEWPPHINMEHE